MAVFRLFRALVGLLRISLRHPPSFLRHLSLLWQILLRSFFHEKTNNGSSIGRDPATQKPPLRRSVDVDIERPRLNHFDDESVCASKLPLTMGTEPDDPLGAPIGERDNSRASSRARSHVEETGICTASPSHEPINRAPVGPVPPRMAMDEVFGLGSETLEIASVEYGQPNQLRSGWKTIYPIMVVNRYERQITL